jgi:hypothetical protein
VLLVVELSSRETMMTIHLSSPVYDKVLRRNIANFLTTYWYGYQEERCRRWLRPLGIILATNQSLLPGSHMFALL